MTAESPRRAARPEAAAQSSTPEAVSAFGVTRERTSPPMDLVASVRAPTVYRSLSEVT